jgi:hypothetical protein
MKYIFLDTNIFLHFQDFGIIWIIFLKPVKWLFHLSYWWIRRKKISTNKIGNRAKVLHRFEQLAEMERYFRIKEILILKFFFFVKNQVENLDANELNFDERLDLSRYDSIQRRLWFKWEILLCSNDIGPELRAKMYGIKSLKLDSKYLIPDQNIWKEKKLEPQRKSNSKNKIPQIRCFCF